jgi:putative glutamine amidotransferase
MSDSKIRIGISLRIVESINYIEKRDALSHDWPPLIEKLNALPIFIPNALTKLDEFLEDIQMDGLVLSGGDDIGKNPERDLCEKKIIDFGIKHKIPIFGVCRGMQAINSYFNGKIETLTNSKHVDNPHSVKIVNSNFSSLLKADSIEVNSYHNNIIKQNILGNELEPFALSFGDETIEGFFHRKFPIVGVMWHPERDPNHINKIILSKVFHEKNFWN